MRLKDRRRQLQRLTIREAPIYARNGIEEVRLFLTRTLWRISRHFSKFKIASRPSLEQILYLAAISYQPKPSECSTVLFRAKEAPITSVGDPYLGWHELLTGRCEIYEIPGDHAGIFSEPNVKVLAQQMRICLNNAKLANAGLQKQALRRIGSELRPRSPAATQRTPLNPPSRLESKIPSNKQSVSSASVVSCPFYRAMTGTK